MKKLKWYLNVVMETKKVINKGQYMDTKKINFIGSYYRTKRETLRKIKQIRKLVDKTK